MLDRKQAALLAAFASLSLASVSFVSTSRALIFASQSTAITLQLVIAASNPFTIISAWSACGSAISAGLLCLNNSVCQLIVLLTALTTFLLVAARLVTLQRKVATGEPSGADCRKTDMAPKKPVVDSAEELEALRSKLEAIPESLRKSGAPETAANTTVTPATDPAVATKAVIAPTSAQETPQKDVMAMSQSIAKDRAATFRDFVGRNMLAKQGIQQGTAAASNNAPSLPLGATAMDIANPMLAALPTLRTEQRPRAQLNIANPVVPTNTADTAARATPLRAPQVTYQSRLRPRIKVCLKVETEKQVSDLPDNMAMCMQQALNDLGGVQLQVANVSVRSGCIMLLMDLVEQPKPCNNQLTTIYEIGCIGHANTLPSKPHEAASAATDKLRSGVFSTPDNDAGVSQAHKAVFKRLLAGLQQVLTRNRAGKITNKLEDGMQVRIQVGDAVIVAQWSATDRNWSLDHELAACEDFFYTMDEIDPVPATDATTTTSPPPDIPTVFSKEASQMLQSSSSASQLWLGIASTCDSVHGMVSQTLQTPRMSKPMSSGSVHSSAASSSSHSNMHGPTAQTARKKDGFIECSVLVQLWGSGISQRLQVSGWNPPTNAQVNPAPLSVSDSATSISYAHTVTPRKVRILAKAGGCYIVTKAALLSVPMASVSSLSTSAMAGPAVIQVWLELPEALLIRHHKDGPASVLQLVTIELWEETETLISSTPLLFITPQCTAASTDRTHQHAAPPGYTQSLSEYGIKQRLCKRLGLATGCSNVSSDNWWWGASTRTVHGFVQELANAEVSIWAAARSLTDDSTALQRQQLCTAVNSHKDLCEDLLLWLSTVRRMACVGSQVSKPSCACSSACMAATDRSPLLEGWLTVLPVSVSELQTLEQLASGLKEYAAAAQFPNLSDLIQQTSKNILAATAYQINDPAAMSSMLNEQAFDITDSWSCSATATALRTYCLGFQCSMCEQVYKNWLSSQLAYAQRYSSAVVALMGIAWLCRFLSNNHDKWCAWYMVPMITLHMAVVWLHFHNSQRPRVGASNSTNQKCQVPIIPAYVTRVGIQCLHALGLAPLPEVSVRIFLTHAWAAKALMFTLSDQLQSSTLLPTPIATCIDLLLDLPSIWWCTVRAGANPLYNLMLAVSSIFCVRLLLDIRLRRMLIRKQQQHQQQQTLVPQSRADGRADASSSDLTVTYSLPITPPHKQRYN